MNLQYLTDVHTRRHTKRVQHDINRCSIRHIRHILYRKNLGDDTLVTVTSGHFITLRNLTLLNDVYFYCFIDSKRQVVSFASFEDADGVNDTSTTMRYLQGVITYLTGFLTEYSQQQLFLWRDFALPLRCYLTD